MLKSGLSLQYSSVTLPLLAEMDMVAPLLGVGVGMGVSVAVGTDVAVGAGLDVAVGAGLDVAVGAGLDVAVGVIGVAVGVAVGSSRSLQ